MSDVDRCRPYGIPIDRDALPIDDVVTDMQAWVTGRFDSLKVAVERWTPNMADMPQVTR